MHLGARRVSPPLPQPSFLPPMFLVVSELTGIEEMQGQMMQSSLVLNSRALV